MLLCENVILFVSPYHLLEPKTLGATFGTR